ncbi:protein of unknown function [Rhodovastum atsumiense]|nr:protein of unknown function [Rhodovastum atsumiense]
MVLTLWLSITVAEHVEDRTHDIAQRPFRCAAPRGTWRQQRLQHGPLGIGGVAGEAQALAPVPGAGGAGSTSGVHPTRSRQSVGITPDQAIQAPFRIRSETASQSKTAQAESIIRFRP